MGKKKHRRLRDMSNRELRRLVKHLESCLAEYDGNPDVQRVLRQPSKS